MIASPDHICADIQNALMASGLFSQQAGDGDNTWRISPDPFHLSPNDAAFFQDLGQHLLKFYTRAQSIVFRQREGQGARLGGRLSGPRPNRRNWWNTAA